ncbi:DUF4339 domain-containing protein [Polyangium mundeleinium]|uniref:DUF4339 domain-containing protein n=1 Tax=Polyangium mundeleinium TaxID=2995306 RepID=A0ABT5EER9_9BACT|nr:DUF4339 domain-containing protein [Polyangium mundeleinium]MDC0739974.1 DUF4339 domain-containing protein [Polyangium mundeleinium]
MPGWELHDGDKKLGPMSEEAVRWAIMRGLPSSTRVRPEGQEAWIALDDHPAFADELVARSSREGRAPRRGRWLAYTRMELVRVAVALASVVVAVVAYGHVAENKDGIVREIEDRWRESTAQIPSAEPARPAASVEEPGAVEQAIEAANAAQLSTSERMKLASAVLADARMDGRAAVCKARALLETLPPAEKRKPEVARALAQLSSKELPLLRAEQAEFEKTRGVLCGDGTKPRDCPCHGAHEACCVLHKGVARCEPLPTRIRCP